MTLTDEEAQFTHRSVDNIDDSFICLHTECAFVCPSADWIRDAPRRPLQLPSARLALLPVVVEKWPTPRQQGMRVESDGLLAGASRGVTGSTEAPGAAAAKGMEAPVAKFTFGSTRAIAGDYIVFPAVWADTATQSLTNKFKDITSPPRSRRPRRASAPTR